MAAKPEGQVHLVYAAGNIFSASLLTCTYWVYQGAKERETGKKFGYRGS